MLALLLAACVTVSLDPQPSAEPWNEGVGTAPLQSAFSCVGTPPRAAIAVTGAMVLSRASSV